MSKCLDHAETQQLLLKNQLGQMKNSFDGTYVCLFERAELLPSAKIPLIILFLLGVSGCLGHAARNSATRSPDSIEALRSRLSSVRGSEFVNEVPIVMETRQRMAVYIDNEVSKPVGSEWHSKKNTFSPPPFGSWMVAAKHLIGSVDRPSVRNYDFFTSRGMNFRATPLLHQRLPVGGGPSSKTWPWWPPQRIQWYSVRGKISL